MSNEFSTMTTAQLREYAETVQAEYDADEINGVMGRQIVRDAWARVEQAEQAEEAALAVVLAGFPVRIRSEAQIADIHHVYRVATMMAETMQPTPEFGAEVIAQWTAMGTDDCLAMAAAYRAWLAGR
jgi:hypothetical protein